MANGATASDILKAILRNCGELTDGTSPYHLDALEYLNVFHIAFHAGSTMFDIDFGQVWTWAKEQDPGVLVLQPKFSTDTVSLTKGSSSGTFLTAPSGSLVGWFLRINNRSEVFRIKNHSSPFLDFELDSEYTDETGAALSFECYKSDYDLVPNAGQKILRLISPFLTYKDTGLDSSGTGEIHGLDFPVFRKRFHHKYIKQGIPNLFSEIKDTDGLKRIRFNRYPESITRVEYEFVQIPNPLTDSDENVPNLPLEGRNAIEYAATYKLMLDKEDDRADKYLTMCQASLKSITAADRKESANNNERRGQLVPRPEQTRSRGDFR